MGPETWERARGVVPDYRSGVGCHTRDPVPVAGSSGYIGRPDRDGQLPNTLAVPRVCRQHFLAQSREFLQWCRVLFGLVFACDCGQLRDGNTGTAGGLAEAQASVERELERSLVAGAVSVRMAGAP